VNTFTFMFVSLRTQMIVVPNGLQNFNCHCVHFNKYLVLSPHIFFIERKSHVLRCSKQSDVIATSLCTSLEVGAFFAFRKGAVICFGLDLDISGSIAKRTLLSRDRCRHTHKQAEFPIAWLKDWTSVFCSTNLFFSRHKVLAYKLMNVPAYFYTQ